MAIFNCSSQYINFAVNDSVQCADATGVNMWHVETAAEQAAQVEQQIADYLALNPLPMFDVTLIDPAIATGLFTAGFLISIVPWATAFGFSQLLRLLKY